MLVHELIWFCGTGSCVSLKRQGRIDIELWFGWGLLRLGLVLESEASTVISALSLRFVS